MTYRDIFDRLRQDVVSDRYRPVFAAAREHEDAFINHPTVESVLATLASGSEQAYAERDRLLSALLRQRGRGSGAFWSSVLLVAFYPCLSRLCRAISSRVPARERGHLAIFCFLHALEAHSDGQWDRLAMRLRQHTERHLYRLLGHERKQEECFMLLPPDQVDQPPRDPDLQRLAGELLERVESSLPPGAAELVRDTCFGGGGLRQYARHHELEPREYERLKRQRVRALQQLKELLRAQSLSRTSEPLV